MHEVRHLSITIACPPPEVYEFAVDPENLPRWASGLAQSELQKDGDAWKVDSPLGKLRMKFAPRNEFGILDHEVTLESGPTFQNPMRVIPNGEGSECMFTLFRQEGMSDEDFANDKAAIERDLKTLKDLMENKRGRKSGSS